MDQCGGEKRWIVRERCGGVEMVRPYPPSFLLVAHGLLALLLSTGDILYGVGHIILDIVDHLTL